MDNVIKQCDDVSHLQLKCLLDSPVRVGFFINGIAVETLCQYSYLGTILDDKMTFDAKSDSICKKDSNQTLFLLRKLRGFIVTDCSQNVLFNFCNDLLVWQHPHG